MELLALPSRTADFFRGFCRFGPAQHPLIRIPPDPQPRCHVCRSLKGQGKIERKKKPPQSILLDHLHISPIPPCHKGFAHARANAGTVPVVTHFSGLPPSPEATGKCLLKLHSHPWVFAAQKWLPPACISRMQLPHKQSERLQLYPLPKQKTVLKKKGGKEKK